MLDILTAILLWGWGGLVVAVPIIVFLTYPQKEDPLGSSGSAFLIFLFVGWAWPLAVLVGIGVLLRIVIHKKNGDWGL